MKHILTLTLTASLLASSCASIEKFSATPGKAFVTCEKQDLGATLPELGLTLLEAVAKIVTAGKAGWEAQLDDIGKAHGAAGLACAVHATATVLAQLAQPEGFAGETPLQRSSSYLTSRGIRFQ